MVAVFPSSPAAAWTPPERRVGVFTQSALVLRIGLGI